MSDNLFIICKICNNSYRNAKSFASHIRNEHKLKIKDYYDLYLKSDNDGICHVCGKNTNFDSILKGYKRFCCNKCSRISNETKEKYKETCLKKYGVTSTNKLDSMKEKSKQTCLAKYGVEYASQSENFKENSRKTCLEKYGVEYSFQSENNIEKTKQTCLEKYGVDHYSKSTNFKEKFKNTCQERYGVDAPAQYTEIYNKFKQTCIEKYGKENFAQTDEFKEKFKQTCIEKYNVKNPMQNDTFKDKSRQTCLEKYNNETFLGSELFLKNIEQYNEKRKLTCLEKYGVDNPYKLENVQSKGKQTCLEKYGTYFPSQNHNIFIKSRSKYTYENIKFDSSWELAYYIYLKDHNIDFEYQPNIKFEYIVNDNIHYYFPDFKINDEIIEIKGDHFFDNNGNFINPYNLNENYKNAYMEKYKCMINNNVKILKKNEIRNILYYIKKKYGKNYLKNFKNKTT